MSRSVVLPVAGYERASRLRIRTGENNKLTAAELAILFGAGALAAAAVAFLPLQIRIPGHVIIKAALPIVLGVAMVPRRYSGSIAGMSAAVTAGVFLAMGVGRLQAAALTSLLAVGPAIDLALRGARSGGWSLYLRFAAAGLSANLLAFAVRWLTALLRLDANRPHMLPRIDTSVLLSFAACGFVAGIVCAMICFRSNSSE